MKLTDRQEEEIWRAVDDVITRFRISVLRGDLYGLSQVKQEEIVYKRLGDMADRVLQKIKDEIV